MYSKARLALAAAVVRQIAQQEGVPETQVRADMYEAMNQARHNSDPAIQAQWSTFRYSGSEPTIEEFILWVSDRAQEAQGIHLVPRDHIGRP